MSHNRNEELNQLSARTEELLARLERLSHSLRSSAEHIAPVPARGDNLVYTGEIQQLPINRQFISRADEQSQFSGNTPYTTTRRTAVYTEHTENLGGTANSTARRNSTIQPEAIPLPYASPPPRPVYSSNNRIHHSQSFDEGIPHDFDPQAEITRRLWNYDAERLRSPDAFMQSQAPRPWGNRPRRSNHIDQHSARGYAPPYEENEPSMATSRSDGASRISARRTQDILKPLAAAVPLFTFALPFVIVPKDKFSAALALACVGLFMGILIATCVWRLTEISDHLRWMNTQILLIKSKLDVHPPQR